MTVKSLNERLNMAATFWELLAGVATAIVAICFWAFSTKADVKKNREDINEIKTTIKDNYRETTENQKEIMKAINDIRVLLERKQDRKN